MEEKIEEFKRFHKIETDIDLPFKIEMIDSLRSITIGGSNSLKKETLKNITVLAL